MRNKRICRTSIYNRKQMSVVNETNTSNQFVWICSLLDVQRKHFTIKILVLWIWTLSTNMTHFSTIVGHHLFTRALKSTMPSLSTLIAHRCRTLTISSNMTSYSKSKASQPPLDGLDILVVFLFHLSPEVPYGFPWSWHLPLLSLAFL